MQEMTIQSRNHGPMSSVVLIILALGMTGIFGCKQEAASTPARPVPEVPVVTVSTQTIPDEPEFIGQTESSRPVEIRSQVTGIIKEHFYSEGRPVKKGDRLYQIDPVPFRAALLNAKAMVDQAEARLVQAKQQLDRVKPLLAEQAVSQKDVDDAVADELAARRALQGAKANVVRAQFDLDNTLIVAPIDGLIERTRVYEGRLVSAQTDLLTTIHQVDPMYVNVNVPELFILKRVRERAEKKIQGADVYDLRGVITFIDGSKYAHEGRLALLEVGLSTTTGTRVVRVVFPNPEGALLPGQFVKVRFLGAVRTNVILVPQRAVQQGPQGPYVYVVGQGDKVEVRNVRATGWEGTQWLIEDGLSPADRVVVDGLQRLAAGVQVKPVLIADADATGGNQPDTSKTGATQ
jgi:membrane fusion protein (multidrug efflux system)